MFGCRKAFSLLAPWVAVASSFAPRPICAAEFVTGQAARAVIGQPTFSAHDPGLGVTALSLTGDTLHVATAGSKLVNFNLGKLRRVEDTSRSGRSCLVCLASPESVLGQAVSPEISVTARWGKTLAVADIRHHRVLLWRDVTRNTLTGNPDVIVAGVESAVGGPAALVAPVSVALDGSHLYVGDAAPGRILVWNTLPVTGLEPPDEILGQPIPALGSERAWLGPSSLGYPSALLADGSNLFVGDSKLNRVLVFSPSDGVLGAESILNAATLTATPLAPGTLAVVQCPQLNDLPSAASADDSAGQSLPRELGGLSALLDGRPVPLLDVSNVAVRFQLPYDLGDRSGSSFLLRWRKRDGTVALTNPVALKLTSSSPGLFALSGREPRPGIIFHAGGASGGLPVGDDSPGRVGETLKVWAAGLGQVESGTSGANVEAGTPNTVGVLSPLHAVSARVNGQSAQVLSAKLPRDSVGIYEVQVAIPPEARQNGSRASLVITQNGVDSNTVTFSLDPAGRR